MRIEWHIDDYYVCEDGNVYSKKKGNYKRITPVKNHKGYGYVSFSIFGEVKKAAVHRLVAEHFCENPLLKPQVNHIDGNKENNNASNLEWCTPQENTDNAYLRGAISLGEENHSSKLTSASVNVILVLIRAGESDTYIGKIYGVHRRTISDIRHGKTWKHISGVKLESGRYEARV